MPESTPSAQRLCSAPAPMDPHMDMSHQMQNGETMPGMEDMPGMDMSGTQTPGTWR